MDLSIIITNWNSGEYVVSCVASIHAHTRGLEFEIIVVDNASTDNSVVLIEERCPSARLLRNPLNLGFARANNVGFQHSLGRVLLFLNPDTELLSPAIQDMYRCLATSADIGVLGCRLLNSDMSLQTTCVHRFPTILNQIVDMEFLRQVLPRMQLWGMRPLFAEQRELPIEVEAVSGACQMINRELFEKVGFYSTGYFMYMEDLVLCEKVKRYGLKVCHLGSAAIVHHGGQSSKKRGGEEFAGPMMKESVLRFLRSSRGPFYAWLYRLSMFMISIARITVLFVALPFSWIGLDGYSGHRSLNKWYRILRWSFGLETWTRWPWRKLDDAGLDQQGAR